MSRALPAVMIADGREDMFPSQVAGYNDNNLIGTDQTTADDNFNQQHPLYQHIQALSTFRKNTPNPQQPPAVCQIQPGRAGYICPVQRPADRRAGTSGVFQYQHQCAKYHIGYHGRQLQTSLAPERKHCRGPGQYHHRHHTAPWQPGLDIRAQGISIG